MQALLGCIECLDKEQKARLAKHIVYSILAVPLILASGFAVAAVIVAL